MDRLSGMTRRVLAVAVLLALLLVCGAGARRPSAAALSLPETPDGWKDAYLAYLDNNYDTFAALWPEGMSGVGFMDLDLDGTPEMVVFDMGASAALGAHLFDLVDGQVYCVSSTLDGAAGAFGGGHFSSVSVCANFFEAFCLSYTENGWCFWVDSANGSLEFSWDEIIRFDCVNGVLTPVLVCARYLECDVDTGLVVTEEYSVGGQTGTQTDYQAAADVYLTGDDVGYQARGIFLWDSASYDASRSGFLAMAADAAAAYVPILGTVTQAVAG